ncbi:hypothetical protein RUM44_005992 [Polyplax serrata]|uniref:Uncharacterized protein n=1 Tax=Polyplax serrata TaxID=468196 RepID=A0ABR1AYM6_POLSC
MASYLKQNFKTKRSKEKFQDTVKCKPILIHRYFDQITASTSKIGTTFPNSLPPQMYSCPPLDPTWERKPRQSPGNAVCNSGTVEQWQALRGYLKSQPGAAKEEFANI